MACTVCPARTDNGRELNGGHRAGGGWADLGGGLVKQRIARQGKGRSGGYRMIVAYREKDLAVFLYGFAKSERENIDRNQLLTMREIAADLLAGDAERIARAIQENEIEEVVNDQEEA